ncbi:hypothetical protein ACS0TY_026780 [Phlomoides rotata]
MDQMSMKVQNQDISENTVDLNSNGTIPFKIVKRRRVSKKKKDANNSEAVPTTCPEEERWNQMNKESEITAEIFSFNVRGLGKKGKKREIMEMLSKRKIDIGCFQETKVVEMKKSICKSFWGVSKFDWACKELEGRAGGILTIWNDEVFCKTSSWFTKGMLIANGFWRGDGALCCIINVYAPCILSKKIVLWDEIKLVVEQFGDICVCVVGDFNSVRKEGERIGKNGTGDRRDISLFDDFITQSCLIELPLVDRSYTWYRADESCKSKLDRMLVNDSWLEKWTDLVLKGLGRSISDHCPILLESSKKDWGSKPFKFFNCWITNAEFSSYDIQGWGAYVLKEKLKHMKADLKEWSKKTFGLIDLKIEEKKAEILNLHLIDDTFGLEEEEIIKRNQGSAELLRELHWNDGMLAQKDKAKWIAAGDTNSRFFHRWINKRPKQNGIEGLMVNNIWVDSVEGVKKASWEKLVEKIRRRLALWNDKHISLGGTWGPPQTASHTLGNGGTPPASSTSTLSP